MTTVARPPLVPRGEEQVFYDALRDHRIVFQRCASCDGVVFPIRTICPGCGGEELRMHRSSGRGVIYSFTTQYRAAHPYFASRVPYSIGLADMDEGFRLMGSVPEPDGIAVGTPIAVHFEDVDDTVTLLQFRRAAATGDGSDR